MIFLANTCKSLAKVYSVSLFFYDWPKKSLISSLSVSPDWNASHRCSTVPLKDWSSLPPWPCKTPSHLRHVWQWNPSPIVWPLFGSVTYLSHGHKCPLAKTERQAQLMRCNHLLICLFLALKSFGMPLWLCGAQFLPDGSETLAWMVMPLLPKSYVG